LDVVVVVPQRNLSPGQVLVFSVGLELGPFLEDIDLESGEVVEFEEFVRAASPTLLRAAMLLVGDWGGAEDLVQTAFERASEMVETC
jgi:hypothetical protein